MDRATDEQKDADQHRSNPRFSADPRLLYVEGAAGSILLATERYNERAPLNLGSGMEVSIKELAQLIGRLTGNKSEIVWGTSKSHGQPQRCLNPSRAERML